MERERGCKLVEQLKLDFYYGKEADQFTFYRLPKVLITDKRFKELSDSAKLLYGLMLDRMSLSARNGWFDEEERVFIKYSFSNIMEDLNCAKEKASKLMKELEDIGLIWRVSQIGRANVIYVKNFVSVEVVEEEDQYENQTGSEIELVENGENINRTSAEIEPVRNSDQYEIQTSSGTEIELSVVRKSNANNNKLNNTNMSNTSNQINLTGSECESNDEMDEAEAYIELIKENIDYDVMMSNKQWNDREMYDELFQLICEVVCVPSKSVRIAGKDYLYSLVKSKFLKLNASHLEYVIGCMERNTTKVANIKSYLITALYNAPSTMSHYYTAEVNHDMYGV